MKKGLLCLALSLIFLSGAKSQQALELKDIWAGNKFSALGARGFTAMNDGESYVQIDTDKERGFSELNRYSIREGSRLETIVSSAGLPEMNGKKADISYFSFSPDETKIMFLTDMNAIYRHSFSSMVHVYDRAAKTMKSVNKQVMYPTFSPDAKKLAYVMDNNLYILDLASGTEIAVTRDGKRNEIINGAVDWVYEEEFSMSQGFEWSPDGNHIAFYRFDESRVKEFSMDMYGTLYPRQERWKYPKAGEDNSTVTVHIYQISSGKTVLCQTGSGPNIYLPRIQWAAENNWLAIQRLNRHQNHWEILFADPEGNVKVVYEEKNQYYIDINDRLEFQKGSFIFTSERSGYNHLYQFDYNRKKLKELTKGNWDLDQFYGYDAISQVVYFSAANENAYQRNLFRLDIKKGKMTPLSQEKGWNSASFTKGFRYFLHIWSNATTPPVYTLRDAAGKNIRDLQNNFVLRETLKQQELGTMEFGQLTTDSQVTLNYYIVKPKDFDATKKYPVLMYVYGGPGSQTVKDQWGGSYYMWFNYMASKGYIVISVDNRGTGFRGEQFKKCTYLQLGKLEIEDQIGAARVIGKWNFVDKSRIGIWGWSFGGYMSSLGISKGADVFKAAVAVAPVTNWRYYDNIYTERFMRTPQENAEGYDSNSPINHVDKIKGNYLIIHGTADDNVHFQNAVEMVKKMIDTGVRFDSEFYPDKNHGIGGGRTRLHLFNRVTDYLMQNL